MKDESCGEVLLNSFFRLHPFSTQLTQQLDRFSIACTVAKTPFARRGTSSCTSTPYIQMKTDLNNVSST
jgi:hypothetical protein